MISEFICEHCNKCYKSLKTLNNHNIKCNVEQQCQYCSGFFTRTSSIIRHYKTCKDYQYAIKIEILKKEKEQDKIKYDNAIDNIIKEKEQEKIKYDTEIDNIRTEKEKEKLKYEIKLTESKMEYDNLFKTSQINYSEYKDLDNSSSKIINELKYKIKEMEKEAKIDKIKLFKYTDEIIKLKYMPTNITNNNNNINIQNIVNFDPSLITGKITDDYFIKNDKLL